MGQNSEQPTAKVAKAQFWTCDNSISRHRAGRQPLRIRERKFQSEDIERLQAEVARRLGYRLVDHRLELYAVPLEDKPKR